MMNARTIAWAEVKERQNHGLMARHHTHMRHEPIPCPSCGSLYSGKQFEQPDFQQRIDLGIVPDVLPEGSIYCVPCIVGQPFYVNVYEMDRGYGGPQEGGWWYDIYEFLHYEVADTKEEAEAIRHYLREICPREPESGPGLHSVAYRGGAYDVRIERERGESYDTFQPWC